MYLKWYLNLILHLNHQIKDRAMITFSRFCARKKENQIKDNYVNKDVKVLVQRQEGFALLFKSVHSM